MDSGEELHHVIRCAGGAQDKTIMNRIMLRFRPIAPKPVNGGQDSSVAQMGNKNSLGSKRRTKRKYARVCKNINNRCKKDKKVSSSNHDHPHDKGKGKEQDSDFNNKTVTLQLLPDRSSHLEEYYYQPQERRESWCNVHDPGMATRKVIDDDHEQAMRFKVKQPVTDDQAVMVVPQKKEVVESWVTVECVTDISSSCMGGGGRGLGCTDIERVRNLDEDMCPAFISDGLNNVQWVNGAYKTMVNNNNNTSNNNEVEEVSQEMMVWLVIQEKMVPYLCSSSAFTCWVRLQYYTWQKEKCSQILPCDVWRMDCGGFAWRLDVEAALCLGR